MGDHLWMRLHGEALQPRRQSKVMELVPPAQFKTGKVPGNPIFLQAPTVGCLVVRIGFTLFEEVNRSFACTTSRRDVEGGCAAAALQHYHATRHDVAAFVFQTRALFWYAQRQKGAKSRWRRIPDCTPWVRLRGRPHGKWYCFFHSENLPPFSVSRKRASRLFPASVMPG